MGKGAFSVASIAENTVEDAIDDGVSNLVYALGNCTFGDSSSSKKCDGVVKDAFDEALEGAGNTLKFTIMSAAIYRTTTYIMPKIIIGSTAIFTYIKAGRYINKMRKAINETSILGVKVGRVGSVSLGLLTKLTIGNQNERLAMSSMANKNVDSMTTALSKEREIATMQVSAQKRQVMSTLGLNHEAKGLRDNKKIEAYHFKMKTGTWAKTTDDKKLFYSVVPKEYIKTDFQFNTAFVDQLNSFTEYARTTENEIFNLAQMIAKSMARNGAL
jgi:hypothetical protein